MDVLESPMSGYSTTWTTTSLQGLSRHCVRTYCFFSLLPLLPLSDVFCKVIPLGVYLNEGRREICVPRRRESLPILPALSVYCDLP